MSLLYDLKYGMKTLFRPSSITKTPKPYILVLLERGMMKNSVSTRLEPRIFCMLKGGWREGRESMFC